MHMYKICHKNAQCGFLTQTKHLLTSNNMLDRHHMPILGVVGVAYCHSSLPKQPKTIPNHLEKGI